MTSKGVLTADARYLCGSYGLLVDHSDSHSSEVILCKFFHTPSFCNCEHYEDI